MKSLSLRSVLIYPYVTLVLVLAIVIGGLSYFTGSKAVRTVSDDLLRETVARISQAIDRHVVGSAATLEAAFPDGMVAPENIQSDFKNIRTRFWIATSLHIDPNNYVYYGNRTGQAIGLYRHSMELGEIRVKFNAHDNRKRFQIQGVNGRPVYQSTEKKLFDPRTRPWYMAGKTATTETWTAVYIDFGTQDLVATRARKVLDKNGDVAGVVATDLSLEALNEFVSRLKVTPNGVAFIFEPDGNLIASSCSQNVKQDNDGKNIRINAADSEHSLIREIYLNILQQAEKGVYPNTLSTFSFTSGLDEEIHVAFNRYNDSAGLQWINVVAIPKKDFMGGISQNVYRTAVVGILATLIVTLLGYLILRWVSRDIKILSRAVNSVGSGRVEESINIQRRDEIGSLAKSFSAMQRRLQSDHLTGLPNRYALEQYLTAIIEDYENGKGESPFALLFIDINDLKIINDSFGHEAGDQALIEFALKLKTSLRQHDFVARYAGDEFVALLQGIQAPEDIAPITMNLEKALAIPLKSFGNKGIIVSGAIGVAHFPEDADNSRDLIRYADSQMYHQKKTIKQQENLQEVEGKEVL